MKKSVILLIGIIFILSIAVVNFFGLKIDSFNENIYVTSIEIEEGTYKGIDSEGEKYVTITYDDEAELNIYQIRWRVYPDNATNKDVEFAYDDSKNVATVDKFGRVSFNKRGTITVIINAADGSGKYESILIRAK